MGRGDGESTILENATNSRGAAALQSKPPAADQSEWGPVSESDYTDERGEKRWQEFCDQKVNIVYLTDQRSVDQAARWLSKLRPKRIGLDLETATKNGLYGVENGSVRTLQIGVDDPEAGPTQIIVDCHHADPSAFFPILRSSRVEKVIQYAPFEQQWVLAHWGIKLGYVYDTCLAARVIKTKLTALRKDDPEEFEKRFPWGGLENAGMGELVRKLMGMKMPKENQGSDWSKRKLTNSQLLYAGMDVAVLFGMRQQLQKLAEELGCEREIDKKISEVVRRQTVQKTERLVSRSDDDSSSVISALKRCRGNRELQRVWDASKQMTVFADNRDAVRVEYMRKLEGLEESEDQPF